MKKVICLLLTVVMVFGCGIKESQAAGYGGASKYSFSWTEKSGFLWLNTDKYTGTATYDHSFIVLLNNLSGTKRWENYNNAKKTAQSLEIGISKEVTVSKTYSYEISGGVGFEVPVKAAKVSGEIGGSYTSSKTYSKTVGTSSAYLINTSSKNGYYAVTHAANCDAYDVNIKKNGSYYDSGMLIRYASSNGYERLWYSTSAF